MKRILIALGLAAFAAVAFANESTSEPNRSVWSQDHNFIAPAP